LVVVPSRTGVPQYEAMKREIEREVGRINGELGEVDWVPVVIHKPAPSPSSQAEALPPSTLRSRLSTPSGA